MVMLSGLDMDIKFVVPLDFIIITNTEAQQESSKQENLNKLLSRRIWIRFRCKNARYSNEQWSITCILRLEVSFKITLKFL